MLRLSDSFSSGPSTIPAEITEGARLVTADPEAAREISLKRGQYRFQGRIQYDGEPVHIREQMRAVEIDGEYKRVYFYKLNILPAPELTWTDDEGGPVKVARVTAVFHVLDNPIWLVPLAWGAVVAAGSVGSWLVIDKVESFSKSGIGSVLAAAAAAGTLWILFRRL